MPARKNLTIRQRYVQYALVGAAIGLYYGLFYKPGQESNLGIVVELSIFAGALTVLIRSWKKEYKFVKIAVDFLWITGSYMLFMLSLALRKEAYDIGGKPLVVAESVLSGLVLGLVMAWQQVRRKVG